MCFKENATPRHLFFNYLECPFEFETPVCKTLTFSAVSDYYKGRHNFSKENISLT